jgi:hypothetical protein
MKPFALAMVVAALVILPFHAASADDGAVLSQRSAVLGQPVRMQLRVTAPADATVELTPGGPSWAGVELIAVDQLSKAPEGDSVVWFFEARVAAFLPGALAFAPTVSVVRGSEATNIELPAIQFTAVPSLAPDAELVLTPLPPPTAISGAESPLLRPAIAGAVAAAVATASLAVWWLGRKLVRRLGRTPPPVEAPAIPPSLEGAERLLQSDPVNAYRMMSAVVKGELARRYNLRATALTSTELRRKLEASGERWEARLVSGLLEECDSVIYAGYRPASERREADLTMAREIVEAGA